MNDYKLGYLLKPDQLAEVSKLVMEGKKSELRSYLNSLNDDLMQKGVLPDYLYYWLVWRFGLS